LKMMDDIRQVSEQNLTRISDANKARAAALKAAVQAKVGGKRGTVALEAEALKFDWNAPNVVAARYIAGGSVKNDGRWMFNQDDSQVKQLQATIQLMDPNGQFFKFWYSIREFCKKLVNNLVPRDRALNVFFQYTGWDAATTASIKLLNLTAPLPPAPATGPVTGATATGGRSAPPNGGQSLDKGDANMLAYIMKALSRPGGVTTLEDRKDGGWWGGCDTRGRGVATLGFGRGHGGDDGRKKDDGKKDDGKKRDDNCATTRGVIEFFYNLADWATSAVNYRCPCSDIQNLLFTGLAPDGTSFPNIGQTADGVGLLKARDQECLRVYPAVCGGRASGDLADIADDGLFVKTAQGPKTLEVAVEEEDIEGGLVEPEY